MDKRYNKINKVEVFKKGNLVRLKIPVEDRCSTDNKRIFCRVVEVKRGNRYSLQCQYGVLQGFNCTKSMDHLPEPFPIKFRHTNRVAIENPPLGKLHASSPLLNSSKRIVAVKGTVLQFDMNVSKQKLNNCTLHCYG